MLACAASFAFHGILLIRCGDAFSRGNLRHPSMSSISSDALSFMSSSSISSGREPWIVVAIVVGMNATPRVHFYSCLLYQVQSWTYNTHYQQTISTSRDAQQHTSGGAPTGLTIFSISLTLISSRLVSPMARVMYSNSGGCPT